MFVPTVLCACFFLSSLTNAAKILGVFMTPSYSHQVVYQTIWKELSLRGHQVTVYTPNPLNDKSLVNLTEYDLSFSYGSMDDINQAGQDVDRLIKLFEKTADLQLNHPYMQDLIKNANNETYDLLLVEFIWQTMYVFKDLYKVPMVGVTSLPLTIGASDALGMDRHPVVEPDMLLKFSYAETFRQRVLSWAFKWIYRFTLNFKLNVIYDRQIRRHFGNGVKDSAKLTSEVSLILGSYNFALQSGAPTVPGFIPISGIHVRSQKALPPELGNFTNSLKNDVIYFSLGTNVRASDLSQATFSRIIDVLGRLPYTIFWKYDSDEAPKNLPKNFYVKEWFPQQDLLGHPKVKLFIMQGGAQSIDEALARKVPMLIIPFHSDQKTNADRCSRLGIAEIINFATFTEEELEGKINKLLKDPSYRENIEKQSLIASDQPLSALDTAVYWIEYVIRHKGAHHLRYKAVDLPFYQYYLLDVYLFVALVFGLLYFVGKKIYAIVVLSYKVLKRLILRRFRLINVSESKKEK